MANYIQTHRGRLQERHYTLLANEGQFWFNAVPKKMSRYCAQYGNHFCVIVFRGKTEEDDAYVMPYLAVKEAFGDDYLTERNQGGRLRWHGRISAPGKLVVHGPASRQIEIDVAKYHNALNLLQ